MEELPDLHIQRPYATLDEYLEGDFWTVERKDMFLIGAASFELGVAVKFTIELADGTPVVTGEGRVVEYTAPSDEFPGGLKVRFRQLDSESKAVLRRALEVRRRAYAAAMEASAGESAGTSGDTSAAASGDAPGAVASVETASATSVVAGVETAATASAVAPTAYGVGSAAEEQNAGASAAENPSPVRDSGWGAPAEEKPIGSVVKARGVGQRRAVRVVSAPPNRDALLGRLRERAQRIGPSLGRAHASGK